jgi:hypothetical protein
MAALETFRPGVKRVGGLSIAATLLLRFMNTGEIGLTIAAARITFWTRKRKAVWLTTICRGYTVIAAAFLIWKTATLGIAAAFFTWRTPDSP